MNLFYKLTASLLSAVLFSSAINADTVETNPYGIYKADAISSAAGTPWSATRHVEIVTAANETAVISLDLKKPYPISEEDLQQVYQNAGSDKVLFFAYSSMIDNESGAVKAISPAAASTQNLAVAFGIQRVFNRKMNAETVQGGWGALARPNDLAILNVFKRKDAVLNGVTFELPIEDLLILTKREVGYDLVPVLVMSWENALDENASPEIKLAYTFMAPSNRQNEFTSQRVNPIPPYFNMLQKGLTKAGADFKAMWWSNTFLANARVPVKVLPYHNIDMKRMRPWHHGQNGHGHHGHGHHHGQKQQETSAAE